MSEKITDKNINIECYVNTKSEVCLGECMRSNRYGRMDRYMEGGFRYRYDGQPVVNMANRMNRSQFLRTAGLGAAAIGAVAMGLGGSARAIGGDEPWENEMIYLSNCDDRSASRNGTDIYTVSLDSSTWRANLTHIYTTPARTFDVVAALACTPDGKHLYMIDNDSQHLGHLDLSDMSFYDIGSVGVGAIALLAFSPDGILYASAANDNLYTVDTATGALHTVGKVENEATGVSPDISGADIVFGADGTLYLWTNLSRTGAPSGLYVLDYEHAFGGVVKATYFEEGDGGFLFTGLAIRANGEGDLLGSITYKNVPQGFDPNSIAVISKTDGTISPNFYHMYDEHDEPFTHRWGDMCAGKLEKGPCGEKVVPLIAGQHHDAGTVTVSNDETNLYVTYKLSEEAVSFGWCLSETHVHVAEDWHLIPQKNGNPPPGQFDYQATFEYEPCVTEYTYTIPLSEDLIESLGEICGDEYPDLYIAAHAVIKNVRCEVTHEAPYPALNVHSWHQGKKKDGSDVDAIRSNPYTVLTWGTTQDPSEFFSLGLGGWIILEFDCCIANGDGFDLLVVEDTWGTNYHLETAYVYASNNPDGPWTPLGQATNSNHGNPTWQTVSEIDLGQMDCARYIKIVDTTDPNQPNVPGNADGFDLNTVFALNDCVECTTSTETAWGQGRDFPGKNWAMYIEYDLQCCEEPCNDAIIFGTSGVSGDFDKIYMIDLNQETMTATFLSDAETNTDDVNYPNGNAYDPIHKRFYYSLIRPNELYFYEIGNGHTYAGELEGTVASGAWYGNAYYYIPQGSKYLYKASLDSTTGMITSTTTVFELTSPSSFSNFGDIAIDRENGILYGSSDAAKLWKIVMSTLPTSGPLNTITTTFPETVKKVQLAFGANGVLYGQDANSGEFYTIDTVTGNVTPIGPVYNEEHTLMKFTDLASGPECP